MGRELPPGYSLAQAQPSPSQRELPPGYRMADGGVKDAVASPAPRDYSLFQSEFASPQLPPGYGKGAIRGAERALLTNDPTQNIGEDLLRGLPAAVGGGVGGASGLVAGAPLGPGAVASSVGMAMLGGSALEAARQGIAQAYSGLTGRGQVKQPGYVVKEVAKQGILQAPGQVFNLGVQTLAKYGTQQLPSLLKQAMGIQEPITQYVQKRGSGQIFTPGNLTEGAPLANVGEATTGLAAQRQAVGGAIGRTEDFALESGGGAFNKVDVSDVAGDLRQTLNKRGYTDPRTAGLARGQDISLLNDALSTLESNGGKIDLRQLVNTKRLIDDQLEFSGGINKSVSSSAENIARNANNKLRQKVREQFGSGISDLYDDFGAIADAQEKLAEFTGTKALSNVEQNAVQRLRAILTKNPKEVDNIVRILGDGLPGGEAQARTIFDSIAAEPFIKGGVGAPSNIIVKALTAGGILSGAGARTAVRGSEALNRAASGPLLIPRAMGPAGSALYNEYNREP